jgi:hypothetical protein
MREMCRGTVDDVLQFANIAARTVPSAVPAQRHRRGRLTGSARRQKWLTKRDVLWARRETGHVDTDDIEPMRRSDQRCAVGTTANGVDAGGGQDADASTAIIP